MTKIIQKAVYFLAIFCLLSGCKMNASAETSEPENSQMEM